MADTSGSGRSSEKVVLKRTLGLFNGCTMILGTIIGSGIFVSPKGVLQEVNSMGLSLIIWLLCGGLALFGALCYAELGTLIPKSGGPYAYLKEGFGDLPAFLYMWATSFVVLPTGNAIISLTFAQNMLQPFYMTCEPPLIATLFLAALAIAVLSYVNATSVIWAARIQSIFTVIKVLALLVIIFTGVVVMSMGKVQHLTGVFEGSTTQPGKIAVAFYSGLFSYAGWDALNFLTEELKNPYRNLPRAIIISLPLVTGIYFLVNISYFAVLGPMGVLESDAVAVSFAMKIYKPAAYVMPILVAFSTFGSLNGCIMCVGRLSFVGAREGHLPDAMALINIRMFTPLPAILVLAAISILMLFMGDIYDLIVYCTLVEALGFAVCTCVVLYMRFSMPDKPRPIKIPIIVPIVFLLLSIFVIFMPLYTDPRSTAIGFLLVLSGIPFYILGVQWTQKPKAFRDKIVVFTKMVQKLTFSVPQE